MELDYSFYLNFLDYLLLPAYLGLLYFLARKTRDEYIAQHSYYKYYIPGLFLKILGGIAFSLVYIFYYGGGDALSYFQGGKAISKMLFKNPAVFFSLLLGNRTDENWSWFDANTGFPIVEMYQLKADSFAVSRFSAPFLFLGFNAFLVGVALLDYFLYKFIFKFFSMYCEIYPKMEKQLAISILYVPSIIFWGSGFMKDTYTMAAALYFTYNVYMAFIKKEKIRTNIIAIIINAFIMITLKPYVLVALLPATLLWISHNRLKNMQNATARVLAAPFIITLGIGFSSLLLSLLGGSLGTYGSVDTILIKAKVTQQDLIRSEQYGEHYFDIGEFDPTIQGVLSKAPQAINAGLFRPYLWEVGSFVMFFAGMENLIMLLVTIYILIRVGPFKTLGFIGSEPLLLFSISFALVIAFAVGLTTANFGALVRYKIPLIPYYVATLFILYYNKVKATNT